VTAPALTLLDAPTAFTEARCPDCRALLMVIPRRTVVQTQVVTARTGTGRGRVVMCQARTCHHRVEVIEHG
jgi:DNA-directed RNA polymerase subunit RPC12/RpoP